MTRKILRRLKFDNRTTDCCCKLVKEHDDRPTITERNVRRAMSRIGTELFPLLFEVKRADTLGQSMYKRAEKIEYIAEYERVYRKILAEMYQLIRRINREQNVTIIMVSHDIRNILPDATHILQLDQKQVFFGPMDEYLKTEAGKQFLGGADL